MAMKINERWELEGSTFDWVLVRLVEGKDKDGNPKVQRRKHFFPRLSQVASYIIEEDAKLTGTVKQMVDAIQKSTVEVVAVLAGVEERLTQAHIKASIKDIANGEVESNDEKEQEPAVITEQPRRRTRKKKAS